MSTLTAKQKKLHDEIHALRVYLSLDEGAVIDLADRTAVTPYLESMRRDIVRGAILSRYVFFDELLSDIACIYFFGRRDFIKLWRTKKFKRFNYYVIEKLSLLHKLDLVGDIKPVPKDVQRYVRTLNDLRNALAHSFYPENLRGNRTRYKDTDVFTLDGFKHFSEDGKGAEECLLRRAFGKRVADQINHVHDEDS